MSQWPLLFRVVQLVLMGPILVFATLMMAPSFRATFCQCVIMLFSTGLGVAVGEFCADPKTPMQPPFAFSATSMAITILFASIWGIFTEPTAAGEAKLRQLRDKPIHSLLELLVEHNEKGTITLNRTFSLYFLVSFSMVWLGMKVLRPERFTPPLVAAVMIWGLVAVAVYAGKPDPVFPRFAVPIAPRSRIKQSIADTSRLVVCLLGLYIYAVALFVNPSIYRWPFLMKLGVGVGLSLSLASLKDMGAADMMEQQGKSRSGRPGKVPRGWKQASRRYVVLGFVVGVIGAAAAVVQAVFTVIQHFKK